MSKEMTIKLHEVDTDGLPDMDDLVGRVAFVFDGCVVSGWPLRELDDEDHRLWAANEDVGRITKFANVTHWIEFPEPVWVFAPLAN